MKRTILILSLLVFTLTSCISRKQLTYLQNETDSAESANTVYKLERQLYKVQPNDILSIKIESQDDQVNSHFNIPPAANLNQADLLLYLSGYTVDIHGNIKMPVIGEINVSGKNVVEIGELVKEKIAIYFKEDAVLVNVQLAGIKFSVIGDVNQPGRFVVYQNQVNIFEAIARAGDIALVGNRTNVQIIRQIPGGVQTIDVDLTDKDILQSPYFFIQPNDIINVKPLGVKSVGIGKSGFETFAAVFGVLASTATLIFTISQIN